jgi:inorganic pyrophosphatase
MINIETEDSNGNKLKVEVTEFKSLADAYKEIKKLQKVIEQLKQDIEEFKNGSNNS